jgi:hypothetical protein
MINQDRKYLIINVSEIHKINFEEILETSPDTLRKSTDQTKTFVKWDENIPSFYNDLTTKEGPYTHLEIIEILSTPEWTSSTP